MLTLLTIVCTVGGYSQEVLYSTGFETSEGYTTSTTYNTNVTVGPSGKQWYICNGCVSTSNLIEGGSSLHMRYYKSNKKTPYAQMKFYIDGVTDLYFKAKTSSSGKIKVEYSTDKGTTWNGAKEYQISTTVSNISYQLSETPVNNVSIKITSLITADKKPVCIDDFKLLSSAPTTTTTFGTYSGKTFTFTNGKLEGFTAPKATATKSDDNTDLSNLIEYTSSDADIVTVNSKTGELTFTNTKFGKATITATLPKTDTYQTSTDSYFVENKDNHIATSLSFNGSDITLTEGKTDAGADFTGHTATVADGVAGTITYAASGDAVATANPTTGAVTINAAVYGTTTITATFTPAYPTQYSGSTATYKITNKKAVDLSEITFDVSEDKSNNSSQQIADNLNKSIVKIYSTKAILGNGTDYRFYKDSKTTFSLTDPTRVITSIKFIHSNTTGPNFTTDKNTYDKASGTWTGYEESVTFTNPGTVIRNITQIIVTTAEKKAAPALSFAEATVTKELVAGTIDLQTITKPEDLDPSAITYASSDDATAKVEGNTIHMYKTGEVTITATSAATDKYAAGTASYKLVIEDNRTTDADFKFAAESYNADLAEATAGIVTFNAANVLQNPNNLKVTYTISPESANATIEGTDGKALIKVSGTYTITAIGANDTYKETTATCTLKVINSAVEETSIEFIAGVDKGKQTGIGNEDQIVQGVVTIHGTNAAFAAVSSNKYTYRLYQDCITTISTKIGKITKIEFVKGDKPINNLKYNGKDGAFTADTKYDLCWVGSAKEVVFTNTDQARATKIIVTVEVPKAKNYTLDETKTDNVIETYENANVTLQRTLSKDYWNTFCVPFALDAEQVTQYFGEGTQLRTYEGYCNNNIVYFATVDNIEAGKPYIMKPGNAVVQNPTFEGVSMVATGLDKKGNPQAVGDASTVQMKGIYNQIELKADQTELFLGDNDLFYYPLDDIDARTIGGLRAYFIVPQGTDIKKLRANLDGTPTSLGTIFDTEESNAPVYNLQGQCVGNSLRALKSGIYIQNGKKVVVK